MNIAKVAVVGAGFMGSGIAQVAAQAGYAVTLIDTTEERLEHAVRAVEWSLTKLAAKDVLDESASAISGRITPVTALSSVSDADLIIEAVFEDIDVKLDVIAAIDKHCRPNAILGSNTSTIPISTLAGATAHPERVIGIHFFGPVPLMRLVEIVPNPKTSQSVVDAIVAFGRLVGKNPIVVKKDIPGFLMNRIFGAMVCEAISLVQDGIGTVHDIDHGMCDGFNLRVGPLCIADLAGLDIALNAFAVMHKLDPVRMPKPPALLERMVSEGKLGAKSGEGFYHWERSGKRLGPAM